MRSTLISFLLLGGIVALIVTTTPILEPAENEAHSSRSASAARSDPNQELRLRAFGHYRDGRWQDALRDYEQLVRLEPRNARAWYRLAYATHKLGDYDRAISLHLEAADFDAVRREALYNLGCAYALTDQPDKAFAALEEAIREGYSDLGHLQGDSELIALRDDPRFLKLQEMLGLDRGPLGFWIGEWHARDKQGALLGSMTVFRQERRYLIRDHINIKDHVSGQGMTYKDPSDGRWKRLFVSEDGGVRRLSGVLREDGALDLEGEQIQPDGAVVALRGRLRALEDGRVHFELRDADADPEAPAILDIYGKRREAALLPRPMSADGPRPKMLGRWQIR